MIILPVLAALATAPPVYTYQLKPTRVELGQPSCGGARRFAKEKWTVRVWSYDHVTVNGMAWKIDPDAWRSGPTLGDMRLVFQADAQAYTFLVLDLYTNERGAIGRFTIFGHTPDREPCSDSVMLEGVRL